jgi:hypothetical protein
MISIMLQLSVNAPNSAASFGGGDDVGFMQCSEAMPAYAARR